MDISIYIKKIDNKDIHIHLILGSRPEILLTNLTDANLLHKQEKIN